MKFALSSSSYSPTFRGIWHSHGHVPVFVREENVNRNTRFGVNAAIESITGDFSLKRQQFFPDFFEGQDIDVCRCSWIAVTNDGHPSDDAIRNTARRTKNVKASDYLHHFRVMKISVELQYPCRGHVHSFRFPCLKERTIRVMANARINHFLAASASLRWICARAHEEMPGYSESQPCASVTFWKA